MVKALHRAGIEVILDVVFNHTERGQPPGADDQLQGPRQRHLLPPGPGRPAVLHGLHRLRQHGQLQPPGRRQADRRVPRVLGPRDARRRLPLRRGLDPVPRRGRRADGRTRRSIWHIELSETLADTKLIAEAWDAAGLYQVGYFPGYRWAEWNGRYRDDIRRFVKGDAGPDRRGRLAHRRQRRHLPGQRPPADQQRQLRHLPRRLHAQRPGLLQREAQRGQRRGQPRRQRRQPELELRRRRARPTIRRSRRCASGRSRTSPRS